MGKSDFAPQFLVFWGGWWMSDVMDSRMNQAEMVFFFFLFLK